MGHIHIIEGEHLENWKHQEQPQLNEVLEIFHAETNVTVPVVIVCKRERTV